MPANVWAITVTVIGLIILIAGVIWAITASSKNTSTTTASHKTEAWVVAGIGLVIFFVGLVLFFLIKPDRVSKKKET